MDDLNNKGAQMEKIKKELFKLNREIRRMEQEGLIKKKDPAEYLNELIREKEMEDAKLLKSHESSSDINSPIDDISAINANIQEEKDNATADKQLDEKTDDRITEAPTAVY